MQAKFFLILCILLSVAICDRTQCSDKAILTKSGNNYTIANNDITGDKTLAFNGVASCASLETDENEVCCYIKVKFENEQLDEKFTHKGCISINQARLYDDADPDIDDMIEDLEENHDYYLGKDSDGDDLLLKYKNVEIDCSSRFIEIAGFALLLFLL